jgi:GWxTD domain-containing protein
MTGEAYAKSVRYHEATMNRVIAFSLVFLTTFRAIAALSPQLQEWGNGPAQWIMTPDEQRAWRKVTTDSDAVAFIDLFWARRDPSRDTAVNEFRDEFESRVAYSDKTFGEKHKRGALTDRGRVYIMMGAPTSMGGMIGQSTSQMSASDSANDSGGARQTSTRHTWLWERADARKFDMSRIEVVFVEDPITHRVQRDPLRADFGRAGPTAIRKTVVNPDLTAVPPWAATGGLVPVARVTEVEVPFPPPAPAPVAPPEEAAPAVVPDEAPAMASKTAGVSKLTLLARGSIDARAATDPFAVQSETTFKAGHDVPWAVQYCSAKAEVPKLNVMLLIVGPLDGRSTEQRTRPKQAKPERMTAQPGCYVLQGMAPVAKLTGGRYKLSVLIDDAVTGAIHDVKREFRVE